MSFSALRSKFVCLSRESKKNTAFWLDFDYTESSIGRYCMIQFHLLDNSQWCHLSGNVQQKQPMWRTGTLFKLASKLIGYANVILSHDCSFQCSNKCTHSHTLERVCLALATSVLLVFVWPISDAPALLLPQTEDAWCSHDNNWLPDTIKTLLITPGKQTAL